ncbi:molybdopterin cofactor-binding domain-containing protein [Muricoccus pecuniae]|uniref:Nicotinate dehydrogenase subunit B n=1 Tax=Muricoccus pecuniae TaxID=693023 RepID=A0A840XU04_9PROT|nr:molybdopterin cofactor-binding domain-containing protein [Roseomonas pecuniae]MBB5692035.1 nicotinate dehydrogenase subunit B [Roseomonas pecuniae]
MTPRAGRGLTRQEVLREEGVLAITRPRAPLPGTPPGANERDERDVFIAVFDDGSVAAFNGHVDLGTGIRTALAQIVAEELDVPLDAVTMVLGDTDRAPDQGPTIASETIQVSALPLRAAAAEARRALLALAAARLGTEGLSVSGGVVSAPDGRLLSYAELLRGAREVVPLSGAAPLKRAEDYRIVGQPAPRVDIPAKATGGLVFVHDMRVPGMLHGRVVRPPYAGLDGGAFVGSSLLSVDRSSVSHIPGLVEVVVAGDFVGVVAEREEEAARAARELRLAWKAFSAPAGLEDVETALRLNPSTRRELKNTGEVDTALQGAAKRMTRSYSWPYQMHASIGPSCAVADFAEGRLRLWSGTQNPHMLRGALAQLMDMPEARIEVTRMEAAGCYGRNCADDVCGDAALLSRAVGRPVRVQLTREQEHLWEPKGAAQLIDVDGGLDASGGVSAYDFVSRYPSNDAPLLGLLLTGKVKPEPAVLQMGDRTAIPPYDYPAMRIAVEDMPPILRASWFRGVSALPSTFAHESWIDECAAEARVDPVEYRLRYLKDPRAAELVRAVAERAGWEPRTGPRMRGEGDILRGQGFAYALYVHGKFPGVGAAWAAWVAEVEVNRRTGEVTATRIVTGHDAGLMINPAGVRHQVHGNVIQTTSRALKERVPIEDGLVAAKEWGGYPILDFREVPEVEVLLMPRPEEPPLGAGESASVPGAAAIANAIFDATGVRFRSAPFTPEVIRAGLQPVVQAEKGRKRRRWFGGLGALAGGLVVAAGAAVGWASSIAPVRPPGADVFSAAQIERGRLLAAAGNCAGCHTAPGGATNAGGVALDTPFGRIWSTNITPDAATGIGAWSFAAFQRAMREGIARDGRHLYPAFPYTAYTKMTDEDLLALYAWLMAQAPMRSEVPETRLAFPYNLRPLMAGWNLLFHRPGSMEPDPLRTAEWNRGNYLVNALGHCGACHTPRNALGAERASAAFAGAMVEGWEAPALNALSQAPLPWTEGDFYEYLRNGHSARHGVAAGSMAPVVAELRALPEADIRAMANYLASLNPVSEAGDAAALVASTAPRGGLSEGARLFAGACGACHGGGAQEGPEVALALNSSIHSDRPDNLLRVVLDGIRPSLPGHGEMPGFRESLSDRQVEELLRFIRANFAPGRAPWADLPRAIARSRTTSDSASF